MKHVNYSIFSSKKFPEKLQQQLPRQHLVGLSLRWEVDSLRTILFVDPWEALDRILSRKITQQLAESIWMPHDLVIDLCHVPVHHPAAGFAHKSV